MFISLIHSEHVLLFWRESSWLKHRFYKAVIFRLFSCLIFTQKWSLVDHARDIKQIYCNIANDEPRLIFLFQVLGVLSLLCCDL